MTAGSPLSWIGGKFYLAGKLIKLFPEHKTYVEAFGGAAHVLFRKAPSPIEVYNDIDDRLVNFFNVVHDEVKCAELRSRVERTLYARSVFNAAKADGGGDEIDRAYNFFVVNRMSFGAKMGTWGVDVTHDRNCANVWAGIADRIKTGFQRMKHVQIENSGFEYILKRYDYAGAFFYLDPPYPFTGERGADKIYRYEMTDGDHARMVRILLEIKGKAMLSGYDSPLYDALCGNGWRKVEMGESMMHIKRERGTVRTRKTEFIWVNY